MEKKITLLISNLGSGGAQRTLFMLTSYFKKRNYEVSLICLNDISNDFFEISKKIKVLKLNYFFLNSKSFICKIINNLSLIYNLRKTLKKMDSKIIISFIGQNNILTIISSLFLNNKLIISERNDPSKQSLGFYWDILRFVFYRYADFITVNSVNAKKYLKKYVPARKLNYVVNHSPMPAETNFNKTGKTLTAVGRVDYQKGYDILLKAFVNSIALQNKWKLNIIGSQSNSKYFNDLFIKYEDYIDKYIFFYKEKKNIYYYLQKSSSYIISSRYEGTPNSLLESASYGLPCIVSDSILLHNNILVNKENVILFENENVDSCTIAINYLIKNYEKSLLYGLKLKKLILKNYSLNEANKSWDRILNELVH